MISDKVGQIITKIHKASLSRQLKWKQLGRDERYEIAFANSSIIIGTELDREVNETYPALSILNDEGVKILEVNGGNIDKYLPEATYKILEEILESAEASILKKDETLEDIIKGLDTITVPRPPLTPSLRSSSSSSTTTATTTTTTKPPKQS